jgi:hypothetical protein
MRSIVLALAVLSLGFVAQAKPRTGNVSFSGIQVRVILDEENQTFQIGESKFKAAAQVGSKGLSLVGDTKKVGINTWDEKLTATIWPRGGNGGDPLEYNCENSRITIIRARSDGKVTVVKNECAYLE